MAKQNLLFWAAALAVVAFFVKQTEPVLAVEQADETETQTALFRADSIIQEAIDTGNYLAAAQALADVNRFVKQTKAYIEKLNFFAAVVSNSVFEYALVKSILTIYVTQLPAATVGIATLESKITNLSGGY